MLSYSYVKDIFDYRPDGNLIWKKRRKGVTIGNVAGSTPSGWYTEVHIDQKSYLAHRVIWLWHHGYMPENDLDHINKIKHDNRIENLREASRQCNARNTGNHISNSSGVKGVHWGRSIERWCSSVTVDNSIYYIGSYLNLDNAVLARLAAEQCLNWDGCDSSSPAYRYAVKNGLIKPYT